MLNSQKNDARDIFPPPRWVSRKRNYGRPFYSHLTLIHPIFPVKKILG
jgi:hypothetical protein